MLNAIKKPNWVKACWRQEEELNGFMEGPSNLRRNRGHAKEIHTNGSNIQDAISNLVLMNGIRMHSLNKCLAISSYCGMTLLGVGIPWGIKAEVVVASSSLLMVEKTGIKLDESAWKQMN